MINTINLAPILHRFRDIAFDRSTIANRNIRLSLLCLTPPMEGVHVHYLHKILPGCQLMANVPNGIETRTLQTDRRDRQTDGRAMTYSERERDFTFANKMVIAVLHICTQ